MKWADTVITTKDGKHKAIAPEIISASRSTDIPAFYSEWFINRLREGYVKWVNPFNQRAQYVSFSNTKAIVFWTKNPQPLLKYLHEVDERRIAYYFHFTLNDYESENLEPGVPQLRDRIGTFKALSSRIGKDSVIWRFDPLILTNTITIKTLLEKIRRVGDEVAPFTAKLVFSFADIREYRKVQSSMQRAGVEYDDFTTEKMAEVAEGIASLCREWGIVASTCAEPIDLMVHGIEHNRCIDDRLLLKITHHDHDIQRLFGVGSCAQGDLFASNSKKVINIKDQGQRLECGCVFSKDIGQYNTCPHLCTYCYANKSENVVRRHVASFSVTSETIIPSCASRNQN